MTENNEILKIDEILPELQWLREQNEQLKSDNKILGNELTYFKERCVDLEEEANNLSSELLHFKSKSLAFMERCRDLSKENEALKLEIKDMKFTRKYLTSEEAGKAFARELLGKPMTEADLAEERFIENGVKEYENGLRVLGDDY